MLWLELEQTWWHILKIRLCLTPLPTPNSLSLLKYYPWHTKELRGWDGSNVKLCSAVTWVFGVQFQIPRSCRKSAFKEMSVSLEMLRSLKQFLSFMLKLKLQKWVSNTETCSDFRMVSAFIMSWHNSQTPDWGILISPSVIWGLTYAVMAVLESVGRMC